MSRNLNGTAIRKVMVSKLVHDPRVNREPKAAYVRRIVDDFDERAISVIEVSERSDGSFVVLNGWHRVSALHEKGYGDEFVQCRIHKGLSVTDEAALSRLLNNTRRFAAIEDFLKGIEAGDPDILAMNAAIENAGLHVGAQRTERGSLLCVNKIKWIYYGGRNPSKRETHAEELGVTLAVITSAWGTVPQATDGHLVQGVGILFLRHGEEIIKADLIRKLSKFPGGPGALLGQARGLRELRGGTVSSSVAAGIVDIYNRGRRSRRLQLVDTSRADPESERTAA